MGIWSFHVLTDFCGSDSFMVSGITVHVPRSLGWHHEFWLSCFCSISDYFLAFCLLFKGFLRTFFFFFSNLPSELNVYCLGGDASEKPNREPDEPITLCTRISQTGAPRLSPTSTEKPVLPPRPVTAWTQQPGVRGEQGLCGAWCTSKLFLPILVGPVQPRAKDLGSLILPVSLAKLWRPVSQTLI